MTTYACLSQQRFEYLNRFIRPVQVNDIESIRQWRNAQKNILRQIDNISQEQQESYFTKVIFPELANLQPSNILFTYFLDNVPIGYGGLVHIAWEHLRAEISFLVAPERAAASEKYTADFSSFVSLMKIVAFEHLGLHRLFTETYDIRPLHISIIESSGFLREGVMRHHVRIHGHPVDSLIHGCLNSYEK